MKNLDFSDSYFETISTHHVGNAFIEDGYFTTAQPLHLADDTNRGLLHKYLLSHFSQQPLWYTFTHDTDLSLNETYETVKQMFDNPEAFHSLSKNIARLLYESSHHPKIRSGELYVVQLSGVKVGHEVVEAIGIFKSETKEHFLKVTAGEDKYEIDSEVGVNINKADVGCIIINHDAQNGYLVQTFNNGKGEVAKYFSDEFLRLKAVPNGYLFTQNHILFCKDFITNKLGEHFEISAVDRTDLLNKTSKFFNDKDHFEQTDFEREVFKQPEIIDLYHEYRQEYEQSNPNSLPQEFDISEKAVKSGKKFLKSVIKLDKNFHIYLHGNKDYVEKGYDETQGLNFYKIYYKQES